jgi:hypothetical protein
MIDEFMSNSNQLMSYKYWCLIIDDGWFLMLTDDWQLIIWLVKDDWWFDDKHQYGNAHIIGERLFLILIYDLYFIWWLMNWWCLLLIDNLWFLMLIHNLCILIIDDVVDELLIIDNQ